MRQRNHGLRKLCEHPRKKWPKCPCSWHFNFKPKGGPSYRFSVDAEVGHHIEGKTEAEKFADAWRTQIRDGKFRRRDEAVPEPTPSAPDTVTLAEFGRIYFERRGKAQSADERSRFARFVAFTPDGQPSLGDTRLRAITRDQIRLFFSALKQEGRAASTKNKYVQLVKAMLSWGVEEGYLERSPVDTKVVKREQHAKRDRRLVPDVLDDKGNAKVHGEEGRLLAVAGSHLRRLIIAALETGMRRGEMLNLLWADVDLQSMKLFVRAENTKTRKARRLPISPRLAGELEMAKTVLTVALFKGERLSDQEQATRLARCYVFGNEAGQKVRSPKRAWQTAVLKAHGHTPAWGHGNQLVPLSREALAAIDLHFHDLRHEAGSRWLEAGYPLHHVQVMLGHKNLSQTSTYLNATEAGIDESSRRFDENVRRCKPVASEQQIDPLPTCNEDTSDTPQPLVN